MRYLQQTNLPEIDQVAILNKGMPWTFKPHLVSSSITRPSDWLLVALELEATFKKSKLQGPQPFKQNYGNSYQGPPKNPAVAGHASMDEKQQRPIPFCKICKRINIDIRHWHANCPNRKERTGPPVETTNVSENL